MRFGNCTSYFNTDAELSRHIDTEHCVDRLRCGINGCNVTCTKKGYLTKHRKKEHPNMKLCMRYLNCTSYFKTHAELKKHKVTEHGLIMTYIQKRFYGLV